MGGCIVPMEVSQGSACAMCSSDIKRRSVSPNFGLYHEADAQVARGYLTISDFGEALSAESPSHCVLCL